MGLPENWSRVQGWLEFSGVFSIPPFISELVVKKVKCPELPVLTDYSVPPSADFWKKFPSRPLPSVVKPRINVIALKGLVQNFEHLLTDSQKRRAGRVLENLTFGASSYQKIDLPACSVENANITKKYGKEISDTIAHWVKEGFACGPFDYPPLDKFRVNSILAVPQDGKVRPVLNVSLPENHSFNDAIDQNLMEKVHMTSAREFGFAIMKCGKNAVMSKFDQKDAYKNVPAKLNELRLQGFRWLGKFFIELSQIFGAKSAVPNYDQSGHTVTDLAVIASSTPEELVFRHLDDTPTVGPASKQYCQNFSREFVNICSELNLKLAPNCPNNEKAFCNETFGKVLGIWFDTEILCWSLPEQKRLETLQLVKLAIDNEFLPVLSVQKLLGKLNSSCLMCPLLSLFKRNLNVCLGFALRAQIDTVRISADAKSDLQTWAGFLLDENHWFPIPIQPCPPPITHKTLFSDAAGISNKLFDSGVASVGLNEDLDTLLAARFVWSPNMLRSTHPENDSLLGENSVFLEFVGVILPFIMFPELFHNEHIVCLVDNTGCFNGWENKYVKNDVLTSILIRALALIASYLECIVHVEHLPRLSNRMARQVDRMSRDSTMTYHDKELLSRFESTKLPLFMVRWLNNPTADWNLSIMLLNYVRNKVPKN